MSRTNQPTESNYSFDPSALEISDKRFDELHKLSLSMVNDVAFGTHEGRREKDLTPVLFVHYRTVDTETGQFSDLECAVCMLCGVPEEKHGFMQQVGAQFAEKKMIPAAIFHGSEAWYVQAESKDKQVDMSIRPSQHPNKKECIMVAGCSVGRDYKSFDIIPISRDAEGYLIKSDDPSPSTAMPGAQSEPYLLYAFFQDFCEYYLKGKKPHGIRLQAADEPEGDRSRRSGLGDGQRAGDADPD